jgi:hypothetical protein
VSPVNYELDFYIPEDDILQSCVCCVVSALSPAQSESLLTPESDAFSESTF